MCQPAVNAFCSLAKKLLMRSPHYTKTLKTTYILNNLLGEAVRVGWERKCFFAWLRWTVPWRPFYLLRLKSSRYLTSGVDIHLMNTRLFSHSLTVKCIVWCDISALKLYYPKHLSLHYNLCCQPTYTSVSESNINQYCQTTKYTGRAPVEMVLWSLWKNSSPPAWPSQMMGSYAIVLSTIIFWWQKVAVSHTFPWII